MASQLRVLKRGERGFEVVKFDKITKRISDQCKNLDPIVDPILVAQRTIGSLVDGISTEDIDNISANFAEYMATKHYHYNKLSARIRVSNLHKTTPALFSVCMRDLQNNSLNRRKVTTACIAPGYEDKEELPMFKQHIIDFILANAATFDSMIIDDYDYKFNVVGIRTLIHNYLHKINGKVYDRPQYMFMRVAIALYMHLYDESPAKCFNAIKKCYKRLASMVIMHASPTLFNACSQMQQLLSCFLLGANDDIERIMDVQKNASVISKFAGGIGLHVHQIRCEGSHIFGTNGESSGIIPQTKMWNSLARAWNQGGKRKGAIALFLEPTHGDILKFLELKLPVGQDEQRALDLFYAIWMTDLFMKRAIESEDNTLSLFSNNEAKNLSVVYDGMPVKMYLRLLKRVNAEKVKRLVDSECENADGGAIVGYHARMKALDDAIMTPENVDAILQEFTGEYVNSDGTLNVYSKLYNEYEAAGLAVAQVKIGKIWDAIFEAQRVTGIPYICYKDHANRKTNHMNIGTIQSTNLCGEIYQYSSDTSYACCTLMSIVVSKYINKAALGEKDKNGLYTNIDPLTVIKYKQLHKMVRQCVRNLDSIININSYPVHECRNNNWWLRPMGIGVQGLADLYCKLRIPFTSQIARKIDLAIFETLYHAFVAESVALAKKYGPYDGFEGSPASEGRLQYKLWRDNHQVRFPCKYEELFSGLYDWDALEKSVMADGMRNSMGIAPMPTVSTSQITGNNECFEPFHSNIYMKSTLAGRFTVINKHLMKHLIEIKLWSHEMRDEIISHGGSVQNIECIPEQVRDIYKTIYEISQRDLIFRTAERSAFVDQSQSFNIHLTDNSNKTLKSVMKLTWELGLKTGSYYIRTNAAATARKISSSSVRARVMNNEMAAPELVGASNDNSESSDACPIGCTSCSG